MKTEKIEVKIDKLEKDFIKQTAEKLGYKNVSAYMRMVAINPELIAKKLKEIES